MVVIPGISVALVDSSLPDLEPRLTDKLLKLSDLPEAVLAEEDALDERWRAELRAATGEMDDAWRQYEQLEKHYNSAIDHARLENAAKKLLEDIWSMAAEREGE